MKNSFFLVIPSQKTNEDQLVSYEKGAVSRWVEDLPVANPGLATRLFFDFVEELNSFELPAQQRLDVLEILRSQFLSIEDSLRSRLIRSGFPKGENERKILDLLILIEQHFTIGYWMVVRELTRRDIGWFQGKHVALAIQRTIKGLSGIVVTQYMMFLAVPDWVWIDLHSLYRLAVKNKKESSKVADETSLIGKVSTVEDSYKQVLLLSLADPSGLMQKEIQDAYHFIGKISQYVRIEKTPVINQQTQCIILMDEDRRPYFEHEAGEVDSSARYLNLTRLYKALMKKDKYSSQNEARFSSINAFNKGTNKIPLGLFDYMLQCWNGFEVQGMPLFSDRLNRYISVGLDATHSLQSLVDTSSGVNVEFLAESFSDRELSCKFEKEGVLSIGSLVSFRKTKELKSKRSLGIVKKITIPKQDGLIVFELAALTSISYAVTYKNIADISDSEKHKALLYGVKNGSGEKSFIILESFMHKDDDIMRLFMNGEDFPIILGERKNIGLGYWQFECRRIEEKQLSQQIKKKGYDFI